MQLKRFFERAISNCDLIVAVVIPPSPKKLFFKGNLLIIMDGLKNIVKPLILHLPLHVKTTIGSTLSGIYGNQA